MAVVKPAEMNFSNKKFSMIISGSPGIGKTTVALSAPKPILIDFDKGVSRVKAQHRKSTIMIDKYEELMEDMKTSDFKEAETVVIDTGGSFITYLQDWAMRDNPTANKKKAGGISMQGFGAVKAEFVRFTNELKTIFDKNIIYIFHTQEEKTKDGDIVQRLLCEGSARNIVWQPCDLGCFMQIVDNERVLGFTPTDAYFAKGCYGIAGQIKVPTLDDNTPNDFLTKLFEKAKQNIASEDAFFEKERQAYDNVIKQGQAIIDSIKNAETATKATNEMKTLKHCLTSEKELKALFSDKLKECHVKWNKDSKKYEDEAKKEVKKDE